MKTSAEKVADEFDKIITKCDSNGRPSGLSYFERVIYYVVSVRCEMDMNGFASVFEQLLTKEEFEFLIDALNDISEVNLANSFLEAKYLLEEINFYNDEENHIDNYSLEIVARFEEIEKDIRRNGQLWKLDSKLLQIKSETKQ